MQTMQAFGRVTKHHPGHPAYRVAKKGRTAPTYLPTAPMAPAPAAGPRSTPISSHPTEAKFERGQWMYKVESRRRDGRVTMRWLPSIAVNDSPRLSQLRQQYLATVGSDRATLIALVSLGLTGRKRTNDVRGRVLEEDGGKHERTRLKEDGTHRCRSG